MMALTRQNVYLDVTKDGVATVKQTPDPIWGAETDASHTAAIDRTPIVRVKLVAPGEDNGNVVKQQSSRFTLYARQLFLKLILQKQKMLL